MKKKILYVIFNILCLNCFSIEPDNLICEIRKVLQNLNDSSIGAIDADGLYLKNSNHGLNCAGFAKYIVDGFYTPLCKNGEQKYMSIQNLRKKHLAERGTPDILIYENSRDPYFGLDWTRNLAVELGKKRGENPAYKTYDVTDSSIVTYVMNCGYPIWKIEKVLEEQEGLHPGRMYLGSINGYFGEDPKLWQHYHIAVFIPYYENDVFKIAVLERNKETSFSYLLERYPNTYCHLVAISTEGEFELMEP